MGPRLQADVHLGEPEERPHVLSSSQAVHQALSTARLEERGSQILLGIPILVRQPVNPNGPRRPGIR
jgi:hypothetical protein